MTENEIGDRLLGCALKVHRALGPGLLESAYEACLSYEFSKAGIEHQRQLTLPIVYDGTRIDLGYRLDLLVQQKVVIEVKAVAALTDVHRAQLLSCLKLGGYRLNSTSKCSRAAFAAWPTASRSRLCRSAYLGGLRG